MDAKRIGIDLLNDDLRGLISASTKIFPVLDAYVAGGTNPNAYEYVRITDGARRNQVFVWDAGWKLIGADDSSVDWTQVENKPATFAPAPHGHDGVYAPVEHRHDELYAFKVHNHDGSYAPVFHNHDDVYSKLGHNHDAVYAKLVHDHTGTYAPVIHYHDDRYASKVYESTVLDHESRLASIEGGYSEGHSHSNLDVLNRLRYTGSRTLIDLLTIEDLQSAIATKLDTATFNGHVGNSTVHVTQGDKDAWNAKVPTTLFNAHTSDATIHITSGERSAWNAKLDASLFTGHTHSYNDLLDKPTVQDEIVIGNTTPTSNLWYKVVT